MEKNVKISSKAITKIIIGILLLLIITMGVSFAYFTANITGIETDTTVTIGGGTMNITYFKGTDINATGISPNNTAFGTKTFTVTGNSTVETEMLYQISLVVEENTFSNDALKYKLISINTDNNGLVAPSINELMNIGSGYKTIPLGIGEFSSPTGGNKVHTYNLEIYFPKTDKNQNIDQGKIFKAHVEIKNTNVAGFNALKGVNKPVLFTGMTPVKWDGTEFINTTETDSDWYDYNTKKWANARTQDGSYWVWIPRYAYKITSGYHSTETGTIDIKFLKGTTNTTADDAKAETTGYVPGIKDTSINYFLHPAFVFNGEELGFWMAKYEATATEGVATITGACDESDNVITKTIKVAPNETSWRCINLKNAYNASLNMKNKTPIYGWLPSELDSHLIKNTEWGAVVYLSKSGYGADTLEVWNNSYNQYVTGCSSTIEDAGEESTCITYETENGQKASTTHNIYGVYDMAGGGWEKVMGNYNNLGGSVAHSGGNSGFTDMELSQLNPKYISKYYTAPDNLLGGIGFDYDTSIYGDAMYETSNNAYRYDGLQLIGNPRGWNNDYSYLPVNYSASIVRGGRMGEASGSGIFYFSWSDGTIPEGQSFRPVLFALSNT